MLIEVRFLLMMFGYSSSMVQLVLLSDVNAVIIIVGIDVIIFLFFVIIIHHHLRLFSNLINCYYHSQPNHTPHTSLPYSPGRH
jgi:hypothetical protein